MEHQKRLDNNYRWGSGDVDVTELTTLLNNLTVRVTKIETNMATLGEKVGVIEAEIVDIKERLTTIRGEITTLNSSINDIKTDIKTIKSNLEDIEARLQSVESIVNRPVIKNQRFLYANWFTLANGETYTGVITLPDGYNPVDLFTYGWHVIVTGNNKQGTSRAGTHDLLTNVNNLKIDYQNDGIHISFTAVTDAFDSDDPLNQLACIITQTSE